MDVALLDAPPGPLVADAVPASDWALDLAWRLDFLAFFLCLALDLVVFVPLLVAVVVVVVSPTAWRA